MQTGHIEGLADCSVNDHPVIYVCKAGCRGILIAVEGHITVDLIGEQPYRIFSAQHNHPFHLIPRPDTSNRVMGIAEYHGFYPTGQLLFEIFPVNAVASILIDQRTVYLFSLLGADRHKKRIIHRCKDKHLISRLCKASDGKPDGCHNTF